MRKILTVCVVEKDDSITGDVNRDAAIRIDEKLSLIFDRPSQLRQLEQLAGRLATELEAKQNEKSPDTLRPEASEK